MKIRTRLFVLIGIVTTALLVNLIILLTLAYFTQHAIQDIRSATMQQNATLRMQAQLRDAEAALYRYQIEGEPGFSDQFQTQLENFENEIALYDSQIVDSQVQKWASDLRVAHREAQNLGTDLIASRNTQTEDLEFLIQTQNRLEALVLAVQVSYEESSLHREITNRLIFNLREMTFAATIYMVNPQPTEHIRFTNAAISFESYLSELENLIGEDRVGSEIQEEFELAKDTGTRLIAEKDLQRTLFAQFAANAFQLGQQKLVEEIQPYSTAYLNSTQSRLVNSFGIAVALSITISMIFVISALGFATVNVRRITDSIRILLDGADRIALGNFQDPVQLDRPDELQYLGHAFNDMMRQLDERQARLNDLLQKLALVQEEERRLVGLDLHDGLTQTLLSANMHLNTLEALAVNLETHAKNELQLCQTRLQESIAQVRWVISELRPVELEDFGLVAGLRQYTTKVAEQAGWSVSFFAEPIPTTLPVQMETVVFRIAQEALSNARKHADTKRIQVRLTTSVQNIDIEIRDWGKGFEITNLKEQENLGLLGMRERTELFGGDLIIKSIAGMGTTIRAEFPLNFSRDSMQNYD